MSATPQAENLSRRFSWTFASVLFALGICVLCGWFFRIPALKGGGSGKFVEPESALLFCICAIAAVSQSFRRTVWLGRILGFCIVGFAVTVLFEYISGSALGIDRWVLASRLNGWTVDSPPGRIALPTTVVLLSAGIALIWLRTNTRRVVDACGSLQLSIGYLALIGHLYGVKPLYGYVMGLPTTLLILLLALMLLSASQVSVIWSTLSSKDAGGVMVRRLAPLVIVLLPALGFLRLELQAKGMLPLPAATALLVLTFVLIFSIAAFHTGSEVNHVDAERKVAQLALIRSEKLSAAGRLAATLAHEINNPLGAALNALYLARTSPQEAQHYVAIAEEEIMRVSALARRSLSFYRTGSASAKVSVEAAVNDVVELFRPVAHMKKIVIVTATEPDLTLSADPGELRQVLMNLVVNAIDATPEAGSVRVEARSLNNAQFEISVRDTGPGIPDELHDRIFEPFFTTKPETGTGLGLYVVKELVAKYRGELRMVSSADGTCFVMVFQKPKAKLGISASSALSA
ncbi:MAG TPA: ATP-binding protein [Candidatus Koribacter sp.]|jgi:signal transduction histidine kinase